MWCRFVAKVRKLTSNDQKLVKDLIAKYGGDLERLIGEVRANLPRKKPGAPKFQDMNELAIYAAIEARRRSVGKDAKLHSVSRAADFLAQDLRKHSPTAELAGKSLQAIHRRVKKLSETDSQIKFVVDRLLLRVGPNDMFLPIFLRPTTYNPMDGVPVGEREVVKKPPR